MVLGNFLWIKLVWIGEIRRSLLRVVLVVNIKIEFQIIKIDDNDMKS